MSCQSVGTAMAMAGKSNVSQSRESICCATPTSIIALRWTDWY